MTPTRLELEREVASLKDRLGVAMSAVVCARNLLMGWVREELKNGTEYKRLFAMVSAIAKEAPMGPPLLARLGWQQGMKEAIIIVRDVAVRGEGDWRAACDRAVEEIEEKLKL